MNVNLNLPQTQTLTLTNPNLSTLTLTLSITRIYTLTDHPDLTLSIFPSLHSARRSDPIIIVPEYRRWRGIILN